MRRKRGEPERVEREGLPDHIAYLWQVFTELAGSRQSTGGGLQPITFREIEAYMAVTDTPLKPWEVETVLALDHTFFKVMNEASKKAGT